MAHLDNQHRQIGARDLRPVLEVEVRVQTVVLDGSRSCWWVHLLIHCGAPDAHFHEGIDDIREILRKIVEFIAYVWILTLQLLTTDHLDVEDLLRCLEVRWNAGIQRIMKHPIGFQYVPTL